VTPHRRAGRLLAGAAALALASVLAALATQHLLGMQPCAWCVLQRLILLSLAVLALLGGLGYALRLTAFGAMGAVGTLLLAISGMAAALWQRFVAAQSTSCAMSLADKVMGATGLDGRWPEVFAAYASCADAKATLLGVPYEFYSLTVFLLCALVAWRALRPTRR
jgi:protein dithiol:quinone oxidoreductase